MGEGMIVNFDGTHHRRTARPAAPTRSSPPRSAPTSCARRARTGAVENNIYQFGHRGYTAVAGGAQDCPYTYMQDLAAGRYRLPWEDEVEVTDGTSCGFPQADPAVRRASRDAAECGGMSTAPPRHRPHHVDADPYPWPYDGDLRPDNTALIVIDMQTDFCGKGGYVDAWATTCR